VIVAAMSGVAKIEFVVIIVLLCYILWLERGRGRG
jgi:uncharacterized membrane protein YtjA (UPF0391 family)